MKEDRCKKGDGVVKKTNRGNILRLLSTKQANTRIDLAKVSQLTKMSVSNIIDEFIVKGIVEEGEIKEQNARGKNPVSLKFSTQAPKIIGVLVNRESCSAVLCDMYLNVLHRQIIYFAKKHENREQELLSHIDALVEEMIAQESNILGIGVASIGPLDVKQGLILQPPRFYGIGNIALVRLLEGKYHLPVYLDHQYNSAARAEKFFGMAGAYSSFVFVGISDGIGAGIYLEDKLLRSNGFGSELGHMSIGWQESKSEGGLPGCIEDFASAQAITKEVEKVTGERLTFAQCMEQSVASELIDRIILDAVEKLAICLTGIVNLLNPELILLGHEGVLLPEVYVRFMETYMNQHKLSGDYTKISIQKSHFGTKAQLIGSACNVLEGVFHGEFFCEQSQ